LQLRRYQTAHANPDDERALGYPKVAKVINRFARLNVGVCMREKKTHIILLRAAFL
jgi:hypothetical protein